MRDQLNKAVKSILNSFDEARHSLEAQIQKEIEWAYNQGYTKALRNYAYWKDGKQFVGSCGRTLEEALSDSDGVFNE